MQIFVNNVNKQCALFGIQEFIYYELIEILLENMMNGDYIRFLKKTNIIDITSLRTQIKVCAVAKKPYRNIFEFIGDCFSNQKNTQYRNIIAYLCALNVSRDELRQYTSSQFVNAF